MLPEEFYHLEMLRVLYGACINDADNQKSTNRDKKQYKRLSSGLFRGIPKFW